MRPPPSEHVEALARQILAQETAGAESPQDLCRRIEHAFSRLEQVVCTLVGPVGFCALLDRAAQRAGSTWGWLGGTPIEATAMLTITRLPRDPEAPGRGRVQAMVKLPELEGALAERGADEVMAGATGLMASLLDLLSQFIGADLTFRLVRQAWPQLSLPAGPGSGPGSEER